ncbi:hypothetical protein LPTSP2_37130 [Leptospira ellinghausenii]|uniref:Uncharacterized protein n=1 Tax=Leptospira ellinghausenii TaxID=1917822 RepID=A0A2P2DIK8_9LEPT|nr:hypothetical protein [Leptospira ellinghausenii]GBF44410.1 hypothetical protein LPTSP2_37130 [Leptospira ellinghausenii]
MSKKLRENTAIQTHILILQNIISRMASNSANCKAWALTLIAAILVLLIDKSRLSLFWISYIPLGFLWILDAYYFGLENFFRSCHDEFLIKLDSKKFDFSSVYRVPKPSENIKATLKAFTSFSTSPFYLLLSVTIFLTVCFIE